MKNLKLKEEQISIIRRSLHLYEKDIDNEHMRLENSGTTTELHNEVYYYEKSIIEKLRDRLNK